MVCAGRGALVYTGTVRRVTLRVGADNPSSLRPRGLTWHGSGPNERRYRRAVRPRRRNGLRFDDRLLRPALLDERRYRSTLRASGRNGLRFDGHLLRPASLDEEVDLGLRAL